MPHCVVVNCKNSSKLVNRMNGDISFHHFPSEPRIKEKWIQATGNKKWLPSKHSTICSIHFNTDCFTSGTTNKCRRLTKTACPTIDVLKTTFTNEELSKDINQPCTSNDATPINIPSKIRLLNKLKIAQKKIAQQKLKIKRLTEQNRHKIHKIRILFKIIDDFRKPIPNGKESE